MICQDCRHMKWEQLTPAGGNWLVCRCAKRKLLFGLESDVERNVADMDRGISAMPETCKDYETNRQD